MAERTTVWVPLPPDDPVMRESGFRKTAHVPVFIDGDDFRKWERTHEVAITPESLLFGAVLHANEDAPGVDTRPLRERLPAMLAVFARGFQQPDVETMVLNVASTLRATHGMALSHRALKNVLSVFPELHRVRSDLLVNCWFLAAQAQGEEERAAWFEAVLDAFAKVDRTRLDPGPRAFICFVDVAVTASTQGVPAAWKLLAELSEEIAAGDEGELRTKLDAFLARGGVDWSLLQVNVTG